MKRAFLMNYVEKIDLEDTLNPVKIQTNHLPADAWDNNSAKELLNDSKTKFISLNKRIDKNQEKPERFISLTFEKPIPVCAISLRSANDWPHMDPSKISIEITPKDGKPYLMIKEKNVVFDRRFGEHGWLKQDPDEEILGIKIQID